MALPKSKYQGPRRGGAFVPVKLDLCRSCKQYIRPDTELCHFCGADVRVVNTSYWMKMLEAREAAFQLDLMLRRMEREKKKMESGRE
jgi:hypothetical protein